MLTVWALAVAAPARSSVIAGTTLAITFRLETAGNLPPHAAFTFNCTDLTCTFDSGGSTDDVAYRLLELTVANDAAWHQVWQQFKAGA